MGSTGKLLCGGSDRSQSDFRYLLRNRLQSTQAIFREACVRVALVLILVA